MHTPSTSRITRLCSLYSHQLSDSGNAERFIAQFGAQVRYVPSLGWFLYTGTHWQHDTSDQILALARTSLQSCSDLASTLTNEDEALCLRLLKHAERSQSPARLKALLTLARSFPGITVPLSTFDAHPHLLNLLNGTLDLTTLQLRPHQSSDSLSRFLPLPYEPEATSSHWTSLLDLLTNHETALACYLQLAVGASLTGHSSQHLAFLLQGPDQRLHELFFSLLRQLSGSYSQSLPAFQSRYLTPDLLQGTRLLTTSTIDFLQKCDPLTFSTLLTCAPVLPRSGDPLGVFSPQATLWLSSPFIPRFPASLTSLCPLIKVIPTSAPPLAHSAIDALRHSLTDALPALLAWAAQGAHHWLASGLLEPACVTAASLALQEDQDDLSSFLEACCTQGPDLTLPARDLYLAYTLYARAQGQRPVSEHTFSPLIVARHFTRLRKSSGRFYQGLALRAPLFELVAEFQHALGHPIAPLSRLLSSTRKQLPPTPMPSADPFPASLLPPIHPRPSNQLTHRPQLQHRPPSPPTW